MNKKALLTAILFAVGAMALLFFYQRRFEEEASGGDRVKILRIQKRIERGGVIADDALTAVEVPLRYLDERAIKDSDRTKVVGMTVVHALPQQSILMWPDIVSSNEEQRDLSRMVDPGSRALTIRVSRDDSSVALIHPGDKVDVIAVLTPTTGDDKVATVLLQGVLVLAVGMETSPQGNPKERVRDQDSITLSLSVPQIQAVRLAAERGRLAVAVRSNRESDAPIEAPAIKGSVLLGPAPTGRPVFVAPHSTVPVEVGNRN
jgi:pilus assembly protein CpaB